MLNFCHWLTARSLPITHSSMAVLCRGNDSVDRPSSYIVQVHIPFDPINSDVITTLTGLSKLKLLWVFAQGQGCGNVLIH